MDLEILSQLVQIKWLVVLFVIVGLLLAMLRAWMSLNSSGGFAAAFSDRSDFPERARTLMDAAQDIELLALAEKRTKQFPGDALAFWYHATAAYRLGKRAEAIASLRKAEFLQPQWGAAHVRPFIEAIESQGPVTANLYAITPSVPGSQDVPSNHDN